METPSGLDLTASERKNGANAKSIVAICITILIGFLIHGIIIEGKGHKYIFHHDAGGNMGYVFDAQKGTLKIFPIKIGMDGFVPHTIINTKNMEANTFPEIGRSARADAMTKRAQESERRPGESDETYIQRLMKLWEKLP